MEGAELALEVAFLSRDHTAVDEDQRRKQRGKRPQRPGEDGDPCESQHSERDASHA
jgi:hypothetical protein